MTVNVALLCKVMEHIEAHPEEHDQAEWAEQTACGTTYCFAGHTVLIAGWSLNFDEDGVAVSCRMDGESLLIPEAARLELGLNYYDTRDLFWHATTGAELREIVDRISAQQS